MTPRQARRILRESTRRERRDTFRGIYKYSVDGGLTHYTIDRHGIPRLALGPPMFFGYATPGAITLADLVNVREKLDAAPPPDF